MPTKKRLALIAGAAAIGGALAARNRDRSDFERLVALPGLIDPVEIRRDAQGIPHIRANTVDDLMCGLGYAMAEDRLWQLDIMHRLVWGRVAEVIGPLALDSDKLMCSVGMRRAAEAEAGRLAGETKHALDRFAAGINAYIARKGAFPGPEFVFGRYLPMEWDAAASLGCLKLMGWSLDNFLEKLLLRDRVANILGEDLARQFFQDDAPTPPAEVVVPSAAYATLREQLANVRQTLGMAGLGGPLPGSNNWAVAGEKTASGKPLLANDPHLAFTLPSVWYECHLTAPGINAAGATIPGVPGIAIGHNDHAAWGITASMLVQTELYIEQFDDPASRLRYRTEDGYAEVDRWMDVIPVKGQRDAEPHETLITRHGPVITGLGEARDETRGLALKWVGQEGADEMTGLLGLMRAESVDELRAACAGIGVPSLNLVFADTAGHIGYQYVGHVPVRPAGCGVRPVPGWDGAHEWQGLIPFAELPHLVDPPAGFIATANTRIPADDYPYPLPSVHAHPSRQRRIVQLLEGRTALTMEDMRRIQADTYVLHAEPLRPVLLAFLDAQAAGFSETERTALELLRAWDGFAEVDSPGAAIWETIYDRWLKRVLAARFAPAMMSELTSKFLGATHWAIPDRLLLHGDDLGWFTTGTRDGALRGAFTDAVAWLVATIGPYPAEWEWGTIHHVTFKNPVSGNSKGLGRLMNIGPIPIGGACNTVNCAYWDLSKPFEVMSGASFRLLVDLAEPSLDAHALACNIAGNSGNPRSPHYRDQAEPWSRVRYHPFGTDAASVAARAPHIVRLVPADQQ